MFRPLISSLPARCGVSKFSCRTAAAVPVAALPFSSGISSRNFSRSSIPAATTLISPQASSSSPSSIFFSPFLSSSSSIFRGPSFSLDAPTVLRKSGSTGFGLSSPSVWGAQRCFSITTPSWIRVGGKPPSSSSQDHAVSRMYPVTHSNYDGGSGGSREMDSLTPYVREHLFRVYSLLGATIVVAGIGSALMTLTPLCQIIPFWLPMVGGFIPLLWLYCAPPANPTLKTALLLSFGLLEGMAIAPLVLMSSMKGVLITSLALTGAIFGGFSAAAYLSPRASLLVLQGPLYGGLIGLMVLSLFSMFYPTAIAHSLILYGGLALFSVMIAADTQAMIERARCGAGDHVSDAMQMFLSLVNIFIRIMQIMGKD